MYEVVEKFSNWLKKVRNNEWKYNFMNENWKLISNIWFDSAYKFSEWYAAVKIEWKW